MASDSDEDPDLEDARAWASGDQQAGDRLLRRHIGPIHAFFDRKIDGDVGDLVQATFEACTTSIHAFEGRSKFRTWLWGVARNKLLEHFRASRRGGDPIDPSSMTLADLGVSMPQLIDDRRQARIVLEAMRNIPLEPQILLELHYWEKLPGSALREVLGVPENTVYGRLRRARALLTAEIQRLEKDPVKLKTTLTTLDDLIESLRDEAARRHPR
jgi:RNA polymerase sigma factor (sigma-70 family)